MSQGFFIVLEGIDGTGKSTQVDLLAEWLRSLGKEVVVADRSDDVSRAVMDLVLSTEGLDDAARGLLFAAERALTLCNVVRPAMERGCIVISDRWSMSNILYQGLTAWGCLIGNRQWLRDVELHNDYAPTLTILLECDVDLALSRVAKEDYFEQRGGGYFRDIQEGYIQEALSELRDNWYIVDAEQPIAKVHQDIRTVVLNAFEAGGIEL